MSGQEPTEVQQRRRSAGPVTGRGAHRKKELLAAARRVFEEKGFIDARVADIVSVVDVSHSTFYTYFNTKEDVFTAVAHDVTVQMLSALTTSIPTSGLEERVHESIRRFVRAYRPHAAIIGLMEQSGTSSPAMRDLRLTVRDIFVQRTRRGIVRMKADGLTDPGLDEEYTAEALGAMLEFSCYLWFCLDKSFDEDRLVDAVALVWERTLLTRPPRS